MLLRGGGEAARLLWVGGGGWVGGCLGGLGVLITRLLSWVEMCGLMGGGGGGGCWGVVGGCLVVGGGWVGGVGVWGFGGVGFVGVFGWGGGGWWCGGVGCGVGWVVGGGVWGGGHRGRGGGRSSLVGRCPARRVGGICWLAPPGMWGGGVVGWGGVVVVRHHPDRR